MGVTEVPTLGHTGPRWCRVAPDRTTPQCYRGTSTSRARSSYASVSKSAPDALEITHGGSSALPGQPRQRIKRHHGSGNALSGIGRGAESIMRAQAVSAMTIAPINAIACLQPSAGMPMKAECGIISRDGGRHCEEERDPCANRGRAQRHEGDLSSNEGDGASN